ncbi:hypothetical protein [Streptomyces sp. NPDC003863]
MTTFALVGTGPGSGLAAARRFGAAGHHVALVSRSLQHQDDLVAELHDALADRNIHAADLLTLGHLDVSADRFGRAERITVEAVS